MAERKINITNFRKYIKTKKSFYIALYQRKFVWTNEKIDDFLNEVYENLSENEMKRIFGGTFYLKANIEKGWEIIDGQQRTTFLYGVTKYIEEILPELIEEISKLKGLGAKKYKPLLETLKSDISSFSIELERIDFITEANRKAGRTYKAFLHIKNQLASIFEKELENNKFDIARYIIAFYDNVDFIEIDINDNYDLHDIFKTINSKNERLSDWDIIRNDIYKRLSGDKSEKLKFIDDSLSELEKKIFIKKEEFIQAYLTMRKETIINKNKLSIAFDELKEESSISEEVYEFISDFVSSYEEIEKDVEKQPALNNNIKVFFSILKEMNTVQVRNISLAVLMSIYNKEILDWNEKISKLNEDQPKPPKPLLKNSIPHQLKRLFINFVLNVNILDERANTFNTYFTKENNSNMKKILNDYTKLDEVIDESTFYLFNLENINSELFDSQVSAEKKMIKFIIWLETSDSNIGCLDSVFAGEYEHVMPQSLTQWKIKYDWLNKISKEKSSELIQSIGNVILLDKKMNAKSSNYDFEKKKAIYFDENNDRKIITKTIPNNEDMSIFNIIFDIENQSSWDKNLIEERTKKISKIIKHSFSERIQSPENKTLMEYIEDSLKGMDSFMPSDIYESIINMYTQDKILENYATLENFKAKIRQTIQYYTKNSVNNKYEPKFIKEIDRYKII